MMPKPNPWSHTGVVSTVAEYLQTGEHESISVPADAIPMIRAALFVHHDSPHLADILEEYCEFACWIGQEYSSPFARDVLLDLAEDSFAVMGRRLLAAGTG